MSTLQNPNEHIARTDVARGACGFLARQELLEDGARRGVNPAALLTERCRRELRI